MKHILIGIYMTSLICSLLFLIKNIFVGFNYLTFYSSSTMIVVTFALLSFSKDENKKY